jgi:hypothetical protein
MFPFKRPVSEGGPHVSLIVRQANIAILETVLPNITVFKESAFGYIAFRLRSWKSLRIGR